MTGLYRLKEEIYKNPLNRKVFSSGNEIYLVGGYLRDLILKGIHGKDIDYAVGRNIKKITRYLAGELEGSIVELRKEHIIRVVLRNGVTLDFSTMKRPIEDDLKGRDFTVNALAWSPETGLIDPTGGIKDINVKLIRGISRENFREDPLRLLRAYRFSAVLSWSIQKRTREIIRGLSGEIRRTASERITLEFFRLICSNKPEKALRQALSDRVLGEIISLSSNELERNIKHVSNVGRILKKVPEKYLFKDSPQGLTYKGLLSLEAMLLGSSDNRFRLSRDINKRLSIVKKMYDDFRYIGRSSKKEVYSFFKKSNEASIDLLILTDRVGHLKDFERFRSITGNPPFNGEEIMSMTGMRPGPGLGRLIDRINLLRFEGALKGRESVKKWINKTYGGK
jgi:tRNA nucleotidyltransferase/poly(A) polymerase